MAAFELAEIAGIGFTLGSDDIGFLFGEDQARYLVACNFDQAEALMVNADKSGVPIEHVGRFGGENATIGNSSTPMSALSKQYRTAFGQIFS